MTVRRDEDFAEYASARMPALRRLAMLLCHDWHSADDLVQAAITKLYLHWDRARSADSIDAYARTILIREFLHERRTSWARRVTLTDHLPDTAAHEVDKDRSMDVQAAIAALPLRQRAVLVLRYHCDLNVGQSAEVLGCSQGTVKSQTAKALATLRRILGAAADADVIPPVDAVVPPAAAHVHPGPGEVASNA